MLKNQSPSVDSGLSVPFDRTSDVLRTPAFLAPRVKFLNGIWMTGGRDQAFFAPDFEPGDRPGIPVPFTAEPKIRVLRLLREFELDSSWLRRENGSVLLRFDEAGPDLSVWINGIPQISAGKDGARFEFDVTGSLHPGVNRIALLLRRSGKDKTGPLGIFRSVRLILQPILSLRSAQIRQDGRTVSADFTIRSDTDRDRTLSLGITLLDPANTAMASRISFRDISLKAKSEEAFSLRKRLRRPLPDGRRASAALLVLSSAGKQHDVRLLSLTGKEHFRTLPAFPETPSGTEPFPVRGPRRDPVSLEDGGGHLWISATNGLLACFGKESGTVESLDLDGISLMDRGPLPTKAASWKDITLERKNGHVELESIAAGLRIRWRFLRSGMIRCSAEPDPQNRKTELLMLFPPHLDRLFRHGVKPFFSLPSHETALDLDRTRGLVLTGGLRAGLVLFFPAPVNAVWRPHRHGNGCGHHHHHGDHAGEEHAGSELLLKAAPGNSPARLDFLILPFASDSLSFDNLFTET